MSIERRVIKLMPKPQPVVLHCSACGATADAACDCGATYVPAATLAGAAVAANPEMSDRAIAEKIGVSHPTVAKARKATGNNLPVEDSTEWKRVGRDGRARRMPKKQDNPADMPTEAEAEKEYQQTLYDQACLFLDRMTGETRRKFFAHIKRKYADA